MGLYPIYQPFTNFLGHFKYALVSENLFRSFYIVSSIDYLYYPLENLEMAVGQRICFTCNCLRQTICAFTKTNTHLNFKKKLHKKHLFPKNFFRFAWGGIYLVSTFKKKRLFSPRFSKAVWIPHLQLSGRRHRSLNGFHGSGRPHWDDGRRVGPKGGNPWRMDHPF